MSALAEQLGVGDEPEPEAPEEDDKDDGKDPSHEMAETVLEAVREEDPEALATALKAMFTHFDSMPHEEGPDTKSPMHDLLGLGAESKE